MEFLCVLCSIGWVISFFLAAIIIIIAKNAPDNSKRANWLINILIVLFICAIGSCAAEERVCEIAGLYAD